jgi:hypothetical protein
MTYALVPDSDHEIEPVPDSFYQSAGQPADISRHSHYPVEAVCRECSQPIVALKYMAEWEHFTRD